MASRFLGSRFLTITLFVIISISVLFSSCKAVVDVDAKPTITPSPTIEITPTPVPSIDPTYDRNAYISVVTISSGETKIPIDDMFVSRIEGELVSANMTINLADYSGSPDAYYDTGVYIHIDDKTYSVLKNNKSENAISDFEKDAVVCDELTDEIIALVQQESDWHELDNSTIKDITSIDLEYKGAIVAYTSNSNDISLIISMIESAKRQSGRPKCPYDARLLLYRETGDAIPVYIATDGCDTMVMGSSGFYEYGKSDVSDQETILSLFGITSFEDITHEMMCQSPLKFELLKFLDYNKPIDNKTVYTYHPTIKDMFKYNEPKEIKGYFESSLTIDECDQVVELLQNISIEQADENVMAYCNTNNYIELAFPEDNTIRIYAMSGGDSVIAFRKNSNRQYGITSDEMLYKLLMGIGDTESFTLKQFGSIKNVVLVYRTEEQMKEDKDEYTEIKIKDKEIINKIEMALCDSSIPTMTYPSREDADCIIKTASGEIYFKIKSDIQYALNEPTIIVNGTYWFDNEAFYRVLDEYNVIDQSTVAKQG